MSRRHVLLFILLCAIWGFGFVPLKVALRHVDPIFLAAIRFWVPGLVILAYCVLSGRDWVPKPRQLPGLVALGVVNTGVLAMFLSLGQREISAALGSIILYTYPLMAAVLSPIFLAENIDRSKAVGIGVGFVGILLVAGLGGHASAAGVAYMLGAAACWAVGTIQFKKLIPGRDVYVVTAWQIIFGATFLSIVSAVVEGVPHAEFTTEVWLSFLWLTIPGMAVAATLWYWLLERGEAAVASAYLFMTPVFGVFFGWLLLHEHVTWPQLAGGALVAASIWLVNRTAVAPAPATAPAGGTRSRRGSLASPRR